MKKDSKNMVIVVGIIILMVGMSVVPSAGSSFFEISKLKCYSLAQQHESWTTTLHFSDPLLQSTDTFTEILHPESNSKLLTPEYPQLPKYSFTVTFPLGTIIHDVQCVQTSLKILEFQGELKPTPQPQWDGTVSTQAIPLTSEIEVVEGELYPSQWFSYRVGAGLKKNTHVTLCSLHIYPVRVDQERSILEYINSIDIEITYEKPTFSQRFGSDYDLVIITPEKFSSLVQPLVDHKITIGVPTQLVMVEEIYDGTYFPVQGRDQQEQIKYFIKDALEQWGSEYILLLGSIYEIPIRTTYYSDMDLLSDLYYADLYLPNGSFCSWDSNNNDLFGECYHGVEDDIVDLYPDVYLGRLACAHNYEVKTVVDKIITYEKETYGQEWYDTMLFLGGDTHPNYGVWEGEVTNDVIAELMTDFTPVFLRTSDGSYSVRNINRAITQGASFMLYSGHGFEHGMGTYPPDSEDIINYITPFMYGIHNKYKLPIIFFNACLTAKLDFVINDILNYPQYSLFRIFTYLPFITGELSLPVYAWCFVKRARGGAIATLGASRVAYAMVDENGPQAGVGYLALQFFKTYESGIKLGEMHAESLTQYIDTLWKDYFTIEEFILLGDPTLQVGGYQ